MATIGEHQDEAHKGLLTSVFNWKCVTYVVRVVTLAAATTRNRSKRKVKKITTVQTREYFTNVVCIFHRQL